MAFGNSIKQITKVDKDVKTNSSEVDTVVAITMCNTNLESVECKKKTREVPKNERKGRGGSVDKRCVQDKEKSGDQQFRDIHLGNDIDSDGKAAMTMKNTLLSKRKRHVKDKESPNQVKKYCGRQGGNQIKQQTVMKTRAVIPSRVAINYDNILTIVTKLAKHMARINKTLDKIAEKFDITNEGKIIVPTS